MIFCIYFKNVSNFTRLTAREITYKNFEVSLMVFTPNITTNHTITYTNKEIRKIVAQKPRIPQLIISDETNHMSFFLIFQVLIDAYDSTVMYCLTIKIQGILLLLTCFSCLILLF